MSALSAYQQMRRANVGANRQFLLEYGLEAPVIDSSLIIEEPKEEKKKSVGRIEKKPRPVKPKEASVERRSSFRIRLRVCPDQYEDYESLKDSDEEDETELLQNLRRPQKIPGVPRPNTYGSIEGVKVGTWWETRLECNYDNIHRPTVAGIHPGPDGAYSVALSGGYEDDVDLGDSFTYTGEGGRDLKGTAANPKNLRTAPQSKHQTLTRGNLALSRNVETGNPVRVIRGYKLNSKFAPERGYRYDGLYRIDRFWETVGKAGYRIYKFDFVRCDPEPAPWNKSSPQKRMSSAEKPDPSLDENERSKTPNQMSIDDSEDGRKTLVLELSPDKGHSKDDWLGWQEEGTPRNHDTLSVDYQGCIVRICLREGEWQEVNLNDLPSVCVGSDASSRISRSRSKKLLNASAEEILYDWAGWPEGGLSVLDCPVSFNCSLAEP